MILLLGKITICTRNSTSIGQIRNLLVHLVIAMTVSMVTSMHHVLWYYNPDETYFQTLAASPLTLWDPRVKSSRSLSYYDPPRTPCRPRAERLCKLSRNKLQ